jgi:hypothetical protein
MDVISRVGRHSGAELILIPERFVPVIVNDGLPPSVAAFTIFRGGSADIKWLRTDTHTTNPPYRFKILIVRGRVNISLSEVEDICGVTATDGYTGN